MRGILLWLWAHQAPVSQLFSICFLEWIGLPWEESSLETKRYPVNPIMRYPTLEEITVDLYSNRLI